MNTINVIVSMFSDSVSTYNVVLSMALTLAFSLNCQAGVVVVGIVFFIV